MEEEANQLTIEDSRTDALGGVERRNRPQSLTGPRGESYGDRERLLVPSVEKPASIEKPLAVGKHGRGAVLALIGLAAAAALVALYLRTGASGAGDASLSPRSPDSALAPEVGRDPGGIDATGPAAGGERSGARPVAPLGSDRGSAPQFEGRGSIRGQVTVPKGFEAPANLRLHIGPSDSLFGRERAEARSQETGPGEFSFQDVPLGGYDVWVEGTGLNSRRQAVLLTQAASSPYVILQLAPTGFVDGFVKNRDGRPARELLVTLEPRNGAERLETRTRADGFFLFDDVPDGEYGIYFGPREAPLVEGRELAFRAPSMRYPPVELPPAADVLIHTTDPAGRPLGEVRLTGFGRPSGRLELETDGAGLGWAYNLPPGRYKVAALGPDGVQSKITIEVEDEPGQEFWIALH